MVERIAKTPFVDHQRTHSSALGFNGASQARGPRSNANQVVCAHKESVPRQEMFCNRDSVAQASQAAEKMSCFVILSEAKNLSSI
jgi:hypothetical protein